MSSSVLRKMIKQCPTGSGGASADENFVFCWQGGEPALAGLDFYKEVFELQKEYGKGKIIGNAIRTNGRGAWSRTEDSAVKMLSESMAVNSMTVVSGIDDKGVPVEPALF